MDDFCNLKIINFDQIKSIFAQLQKPVRIHFKPKEIFVKDATKDEKYQKSLERISKAHEANDDEQAFARHKEGDHRVFGCQHFQQTRLKD